MRGDNYVARRSPGRLGIRLRRTNPGTTMNLPSTISRQRQWQLRVASEGRCPKCGAPREAKANGALYKYCAQHRKENNEAQNRRNELKRKATP